MYMNSVSCSLQTWELFCASLGLMAFPLSFQVAPGVAGGLKRPSEHDGEGDTITKRMKEETSIAEVKSESAE